MLELLFYSLIGGLFALVGGLILLWKASLARKLMLPLLSFGAGAFLAVTFFDTLPEALEMSEEAHPILLATLIGFLSFFVLERVVMKYFHSGKHNGDHEHHTEPLPYLLITGDTTHNFLDGIVIALAFVADPALGLVTALAIAAHEVPQEIADFGLLLNLGWSRARVLAVNVACSLANIPGALLGYYAGSLLEPHLPYLLAVVSGVFLYIAASNLIPEVHHRAEHHSFAKAALPLFASIVLVWYLVGLAHH